ncbi:MAG TPA: TonB family protein [Opitutaceae bacterium]|nr:TonB family protein [Opitutaceae bacterium]
MRPRLLLFLPVVVLSALSAAPSVSAANGPSLLEQAYALDEAKPRDAAAVAALYEQAAAQGDAFAHLRLGYLAETGDGVPQDYAVARAHYQAAANAGLKEAKLRLAICDLEGWGAPADRAAFAREVRQAAEAGDTAAQQIIASMCSIGFAVPRDQAAGLKWLERAAAQDDPDAQLVLGHHAERVLRLMPDKSIARNWYQLSAEQDYHAGMRAMARTFLFGSPKDRNVELGQKWLQLATDGGDSEAPYTLALFEVIRPDVANRDFARAETLLKLASQRGNERATEVLQLLDGGKSLPEAVKYELSVPFEERYVQRAAIEVGSDPQTRQPQIYRLVKPVYPMTMRLTGTTGDVMIDFVVDTTGRVRNPYALSASNPLFAERAVAAVKQWRFYPGRKNGHNVNTHMRVPVKFRLPEEAMEGVDGLLSAAEGRALQIGGDVVADAKNLTIAKPRTALAYPLLADGSRVPVNTKVLLLLVIDPVGHPIRGHILSESQDAAAQAVLASAMRASYEPRVTDGAAVEGHVVLTFVSRDPTQVTATRQ